MYYVIEKLGPDVVEHPDTRVVEIHSRPMCAHPSGEVRLSGWCGYVDSCSVYARGVYKSFDDARIAILERYGEVRDHARGGAPLLPTEDHIIAVYKPGKYVPLGHQETVDRIWPLVQRTVTAGVSDNDIACMARVYEAVANEEGFSLDPTFKDIMLAHRRDLRDGTSNKPSHLSSDLATNH